MQTASKRKVEGAVYFRASNKIRTAANNNFPSNQIAERLKTQTIENRKQIPRAQNNKLWEGLSEAQLHAAHKIYLGFIGKFGQLGIHTQRFMWVPKSTAGDDVALDHLVIKFTLWASQKTEVYFDVLAALDVLVFGKSCRAVDKSLGRRKGYSKENLIVALDEYANMGLHPIVEK